MNIDWHYVNLKSRPDRNEHAQKEFTKHNIVPTRFEGFLPNGFLYQDAMQRMRNRTPGAIGCYQSQLALIHKAIGNENIVAVCEDDVVFCGDLQNRLQYISEKLTWDWDIFWLGATFHVPGKWYHNAECSSWSNLGRDVETTSDPRILRTYGIWSTYAYLVNPVNARKVYTLFEQNIHRADGIDHLAIILGDRLNNFCFVPGCAWQYDNESNIGNGITRFSGFKRLGPYVWANHMNDFDPTTFDWSKHD